MLILLCVRIGGEVHEVHVEGVHLLKGIGEESSSLSQVALWRGDKREEEKGV